VAEVELECRSFAAWDAGTLYEVLALRSRVFVVEQRCVYLDLDGADPDALHVVARAAGRVVGTARVLGPGDEGFRVGRVAVSEERRGTGLGRALVRAALSAIDERAPGAPVRLAAQAHLVPFYGSLGFEVAGPEHDEDGIPHVEMRRAG
jgi:ElaA protein